MKHNLVLVRLNSDQVARAKEENGHRKRITHALICGPHGQRFGTEKQCRKYFVAWNPKGHQYNPVAIFPDLFDKAIETDSYEITDYESTWDLVMKLIDAQDNPK